jgi:hypothetical protein
LRFWRTMFSNRSAGFVLLLSVASACGGNARGSRARPFPELEGSAGSNAGRDGASGSASSAPPGSGGGTVGSGSSGSNGAGGAFPAFDTFEPLLLRAEELGSGFQFEWLRENVALAVGASGMKVAIVSASFEGNRLEVSDLPALSAPLDNIADIWRDPDPSLERPRLFLLACEALAGCRLLETVLAPGGVSTLQESSLLLDPSWQARGLFRPLPFDGTFELCVYGSGIHCNRDGVWGEALPASVGGITAARGLRALGADGRLFLGVLQTILDRGEYLIWQASTAAARFSALTASGAIGDGELWRRNDFDEPTLCGHEPPFRGGDGLLDALDENGFVYSNQRLEQGYSPCRWPDPIPDVIGESYLDCGASRNWLVLTRQSLLSMHGALRCVLD